MSKIYLFCIPYAGGSAVVFNKWKNYMGQGIELEPVELAGRGRRMHEAMYGSMDEAVEDVFGLIREKAGMHRYALFGHSLGSSIAYGLADKIRKAGIPGPVHLFFSGRGAPHVSRMTPKFFHLMDDHLFKQEIIALGGTSPEIFEHPPLVDLFLPVLKNDFKLAETGVLGNPPEPFEQAITVFLGKEDDLSAEQCDGWKKHSRQACAIHYFNGGHFFLNEETERITHIIKQELNSTVYAL